jgi:tripeptide aminopeptidase
MINQERLAGEFSKLASLPSPPLREAAIAAYLERRFRELGAETQFDASRPATGGQVGNLVARLPAAGLEVAPILFSVHMDTVEPCDGVVPVLNDGIFTSAGETVLGADDKAGIAEIIEALEVIREQKIPRGPVEVVVTVAEEIGLIGAKHFDFSLVRSSYGYALDTTGVDAMVLRAPAANRIYVELTGREAHAGVAPELGVSAIQTAGLALSRMRLGRIDHETTANMGKISGGVACNIIPRTVHLEGEARSHDPVKLEEQTAHMLACFEEAAEAMARPIEGKVCRPRVDIEVRPDYPRMAVAETAKVVSLARAAATDIGHSLRTLVGGGGSDANIFNSQGIDMVILGTGMQDVHTAEEWVSVADMAHVAELLVAIMRRAV